MQANSLVHDVLFIYWMYTFRSCLLLLNRRISSTCVLKKGIPSGDSPWYDGVPVGKEKLRTFLQAMCKEAGISEHKTNHSLRATGASAMFNAGVSDKLIRDVTGHRSTALQLYERPTLQQKQAVSRVLVQGTQNFTNKEDTDEENSTKKIN